MTWVELLDAIQPILSNKYEGPRVLVLSSCEADQQGLTTKIKAAVGRKKKLIPPRYIFCATGKVNWPDAAVGWTLLYHLIPSIDLDQREEVQKMLEKIKSVDAAMFTYFRWDEDARCYKRFPSKTPA